MRISQGKIEADRGIATSDETKRAKKAKAKAKESPIMSDERYVIEPSAGVSGHGWHSSVAHDFQT